MAVVVDGERVSVPNVTVVRCNNDFARERRTSDGGWVARCNTCKMYFVEGDERPCKRAAAKYMAIPLRDRIANAERAKRRQEGRWTAWEIEDHLMAWEEDLAAIVKWLDGAKSGRKKAEIAEMAREFAESLRRITRRVKR